MMIHNTARCPPNIMGTQPMNKMSRPVASKPKARPPQSRPFDPDELSRKLYAVLAEQKAYAERKKRAKAKAEADRRATAVRRAAEARTRNSSGVPPSKSRDNDSSSATQASATKPKPKPKPTEVQASGRSHEEKAGTASNTANPDGAEPHGYRHIPQVAASQFARTTKSEDVTEKQLVHRLSRPAMKFHLEGPNASREMADVRSDTAPIEQAKALRRAQSMRERLYERNQFQHASTLHATIEVDEQFGAEPQCRSFDAQRRPKWIDNEEMASRRISTGAFLSGWEMDKRFSGGFDGVVLVERPESDAHFELAAHANEHRVDWTQSDETVPRQPTALAPRKQESRWTLRGRIGNFKHGKEDKPSAQSTEKAAVDDDFSKSSNYSSKSSNNSSKSSKGGFFARLKMLWDPAWYHSN